MHFEFYLMQNISPPFLLRQHSRHSQFPYRADLAMCQISKMQIAYKGRVLQVYKTTTD